jgi:hypothetical protein
MDSLDSAVVDITRLIASCRALRRVKAGPAQGRAKSHRRRMRAELRRAAGAYLRTLARSKDGVVDAAAVGKCRIAAESCMPAAIASAEELGALMNQRAGALDGLTPSQHDLWRLSHIAVHLREGAATLRDLASDADYQPARAVAKSLQKQFRRSLVAYADAVMRDGGGSRAAIRRAREAAIARLSTRCVDDADQLAWLEAELPRPSEFIEQGVAQPLRNLLLDWSVSRVARRPRPPTAAARSAAQR